LIRPKVAVLFAPTEALLLLHPFPAAPSKASFLKDQRKDQSKSNPTFAQRSEERFGFFGLEAGVD
jgi:hypothetical protein